MHYFSRKNKILVFTAFELKQHYLNNKTIFKYIYFLYIGLADLPYLDQNSIGIIETLFVFNMLHMFCQKVFLSSRVCIMIYVLLKCLIVSNTLHMYVLSKFLLSQYSLIKFDDLVKYLVNVCCCLFLQATQDYQVSILNNFLFNLILVTLYILF